MRKRRKVRKTKGEVQEEPTAGRNKKCGGKPATPQLLQRQLADALEQTKVDTHALRPSQVINLQQSVGNTAVQRLLSQYGEKENETGRSKTGGAHPPLPSQVISPLSRPQKGLIQRDLFEILFGKKKKKKRTKKEIEKIQQEVAKFDSFLEGRESENLTPVEWCRDVARQRGEHQEDYNVAEQESTTKEFESVKTAEGFEFERLEYHTDEKKLAKKKRKIARDVDEIKLERNKDLEKWLQKNKELGLILIWGLKRRYGVDLTTLSSMGSAFPQPWEVHLNRNGSLLEEIKKRIDDTYEMYKKEGASMTEVVIDGQKITIKRIDEVVIELYKAAKEAKLLSIKRSRKKRERKKK